jgi:hypothetical protein
MEKNMKDSLRPGEKLRWESSPQAFPLLDTTAKKSVLMKWILTPVVTILFLILFIRSNGASRPGFVVAILCIAAIIMLTPVLEYAQLKKQKYYITDQRIILKTWNQNLFSMDLNQIDGMEVVSDAAEYRCLVFGRAIFQSIPKQIRWQAGHPKTEGSSGIAQGFIFYCPAHVDEALSLLRAYGSKPVENSAG